MTLKSHNCMRQALAIKYCGDSCDRVRMLADESYTFPQHGGAVAAEANKPARPVSSFATVAAAVAAFKGFTDHAPRARGNGPDGNPQGTTDYITVYKAGTKEVLFATPTSVSIGDTLTFTLVDGEVNEHYVAAGAGPYTVKEFCSDCPGFSPDPCAVDDANTDTTNAANIGARTVTKVIVSFAA